MQAFAAETAHAAAEHGGAFYTEAEFWVALAFLILVAAVARPIFRTVTTGLDSRADSIRNQIEEAQRLREEAQELLATYERKQRDAVKETERLIEQAHSEAKVFSERATEDLERSLKRREQMALDRIAQAEAAAVSEVRGIAIEIAMEATRRALEDQMTAKKANALIDAAIKELPEKLH